MCHWRECDNYWKTKDFKFEGHGFCNVHCANNFANAEKKKKQERIEEVDVIMKALANERQTLWNDLKIDQPKYPWK